MISIIFLDSVIFIGGEDPKQLPIQTGEALGSMTSELPDSEYITDFVSGGPKSYGILKSNGETKCCCKGISLNWKNSQVVTFNNLKSMILSESKKKMHIVDPYKFQRDPIKGEVRSIPMAKLYQVVYTKRRLIKDSEGYYTKTLPFGWCEN